MSPQERIEEAHGLWELAVQRVSAIAEATALIELQPGGPVSQLLAQAVAAERDALEHWRAVSVAVESSHREA
jgi:ABC-type microcin C transport system permease subunit YejB